MNHAERAMRTDWPSEIDRWLSELSQYGGHHGGFGHPQTVTTTRTTTSTAAAPHRVSAAKPQGNRGHSADRS
ncbi:hypothetical protein ACWGH8_25175 [Nonomuraea muscovyensis]